MKKVIKRLARLICGDYSIYRIYCRSQGGNELRNANSEGLHFNSVKKHQIESSKDALIFRQAHYLGNGAHAYACFDNERIVSLCIFWHGERYRTRNYWPLKEGEAKLVQIVTISEMRGRGIASALISYATCEMFNMDFLRLYARIWHSNTPSIYAFERAGWEKIATVLEIHPLHRRKPLRITWNKIE